MNKKKKLIIIISIISMVILIIVGGTTAFFGWRASKQGTINVTIASGEGNCSLKRDNNVFIAPSNTKKGGRIIKLTAKQEMSTKASITWNMEIKGLTEVLDPSLIAGLKYEMINSSTDVSYGSGSFADLDLTQPITFSNFDEVLGFGLEYEFTLYLWINGNELTTPNQNHMQNQTIEFDIYCDLIRTETGTVTTPADPQTKSAADYISDLYYDSTLTYITQENSGNSYYYAKSENLMNDGRGREGNIRYYGANPNNYIYFNCDDYNNQTENTCEKWRIIGVFDDKIKIRREESIGKHNWEYKPNKRTLANWHEASLMTLLNESYYNNEDNVIYYESNYDSSTETYSPEEKYINFDQDNIGIKNDETRNMILEEIWNIGSYGRGDLYPDDIYEYERGFEVCSDCNHETVWTGKIVLPYPSDYGFASDLSKCNSDMNHYDASDCYGTNWIYNGTTQWLFTTHDNYRYYAWHILIIGYTRTGGFLPTSLDVHPTLYLDKNIKFDITKGNGTSITPYQIISA